MTCCEASQAHAFTTSDNKNRKQTITEELRETIQLFCIQVFVLPRHMIA